MQKNSKFIINNIKTESIVNAIVAVVINSKTVALGNSSL